MELVDEPVEVGARQLQPQVLDAGAEERLALGAERGLCAVARVGVRPLVEDGRARRRHRLGPCLSRPLLRDRSGALA